MYSPTSRAIGTAQDRLLEKRFFQDCGLVEAAPFAPVESAGRPCARAEDGRHARHPGKLGAWVMTARGRRGSPMPHRPQPRAWESLGGVPCILEGFVRFDVPEVFKLIAALRGSDGRIVFYPLTENSTATASCAARSRPTRAGMAAARGGNLS